MRTLIVDDDFPVRMLFKQIIDWEAEGFQIVGEAIDGEEGLEKARKLEPDFIIVDIEMPRMNGVEMIKELMADGYQGQIIVISCHDDFAYVKEALKLGAKDYILKDHVTQEKLEEVLSLVRRDYTSKKEKKKEFNKIRRWANKGKQTLKKEYLKNVLLGINRNTKDIKKQVDQLAIAMSKKVNGLILMEINHYEEQVLKISANKDGELFSFTIRNIMEEIITNMDVIGEVIDSSNKDFGVIINLENMVSQHQQRNLMRHISDQIKTSVNKYLDIEMTVVYDYSIEGIEALPSAYEKGRKGLLHKFYDGLGHMEDLKDVSRLSQKNFSMSKDEEKKVEECVGQGQSNELKKLMNLKIQWAKEEQIIPDQVFGYVRQWINIIEKVCLQYGLNISTIIENKKLEILQLERMETVDEIQDVFNIFIEVICQHFNHEDVDSNHYLIKEIVKFIGCHYMDDITLYSISEHFSKNMTYVSHLFKQEMKEGFTDYLKGVRMKKAEQLMMTTDLKINAIATRVGIPNRKYFTKIFKEKMGCSPSDFKKGMKTLNLKN